MENKTESYKWKLLINPMPWRNKLMLMVPVPLFTILLIVFSTFLPIKEVIFYILPACILAISTLWIPIRWIGYPNEEHTYEICDDKITHKIQKITPKSTDIIVRLIAIVGVVVSLIAMVKLGPSALIGAGGSILLSFLLINYKTEDREIIIPFIKGSDITKVTQDQYVIEKSDHNLSSVLFIDEKRSDEIVKTLKTLIKDCTYSVDLYDNVKMEPKIIKVIY